jgi:large subunit ribosomal protein L28
MHASIPELKTTNMAKQCDITGKKTQIGGRYSNRTRATQFNPCGKISRQPNLQKKRIYVPELGKAVTVTVSTAALRTIAKNGAYVTLKKAKLI